MWTTKRHTIDCGESAGKYRYVEYPTIFNERGEPVAVALEMEDAQRIVKAVNREGEMCKTVLQSSGE